MGVNHPNKRHLAHARSTPWLLPHQLSGSSGTTSTGVHEQITNMTQQPRLRFYAMPDSPHLLATYCGYTVLTLNGLSTWTTSKEIERITINGIDHKFKAMGDRTLMLIPSFRQEAQTVSVYCKGDQPSELSPAPTGHASKFLGTKTADLSTGLSPATHNRYQKES